MNRDDLTKAITDLVRTIYRDCLGAEGRSRSAVEFYSLHYGPEIKALVDVILPDGEEAK